MTVWMNEFRFVAELPFVLLDTLMSQDGFMTRCFKRLLLGFFLLPSFLAVQSAVYSQQESSPATKQLSNAANKVIRALDKVDLEQAFQHMTVKGADEYVGLILMDALSLASTSWMGAGGANDAGPPSFLAPLSEVIKKHGLDQIEYRGPDTTELQKLPPEKHAAFIVESTTRFQQDLVSMVDPQDRFKLAADLSSAIAKFVATPMKHKMGEIIEVPETSDRVVVDVYQFLDKEFFKANPPVKGMTISLPHGIEEKPRLAMQIIFTKTDGDWKFDGFNHQFSIELMQQRMKSVNTLEIIDNLEVSGNSILGDAVDLKDYKGKVVLIDFWGTWCGPCVASLPSMSGMHERLHSKGFEILGVAGDDSKTLKAFLDKKPLPWQNIVDSEMSISQRYGIIAFPTTLLIDKEGKHVASNLHGKALEEAIELLLDGKPLDSALVTEKPGASEREDY